MHKDHELMTARPQFWSPLRCPLGRGVLIGLVQALGAFGNALPRAHNQAGDSFWGLDSGGWALATSGNYRNHRQAIAWVLVVETLSPDLSSGHHPKAK